MKHAEGCYTGKIPDKLSPDECPGAWSYKTSNGKSVEDLTLSVSCCDTLSCCTEENPCSEEEVKAIGVCQTVEIAADDDSGPKSDRPNYLGTYQYHTTDSIGFPVYRMTDGSGRSLFRRNIDGYRSIWVVS